MKNFRKRNNNNNRASRNGPMSSLTRIVRSPPGTTTIVVPGDAEYIDNSLPLSGAFSIDSNTLLATGSYIGLASIYRSYRLKMLRIRVSVPIASTTSSGTFASSLQYIQPGVLNPSAIPYRAILGLRPNKETKTYLHHNWTWLPSNPVHFDFNLISSTVDYATLYFAVGNSNIVPSITIPAFLVRFEAHFEFYGLQAVTRAIQIPSKKEGDDGDDIFTMDFEHLLIPKK